LQSLFISKPVMAFAGMMQNKKISVAPSAILMDFPSAELGRALHPGST